MTHPIVQKYRSWREYRQKYRRTYEELDGCSDRELAELRISRADIPAIARKSAGL
jgi:uncharacterized protein YjiS (DUF1127 family)